MSESKTSAEIRLLAPSLDARMFRNQVGHYVLADPNCKRCARGRRITSGLAVGSSDLIGWTTIEITPDMVGRTVAVFTSIEVKSAKGKASAAQHSWIRAVVQAGGLAGIARDIKMAGEILARKTGLHNL